MLPLCRKKGKKKQSLLLFGQVDNALGAGCVVPRLTARYKSHLFRTDYCIYELEYPMRQDFTKQF